MRGDAYVANVHIWPGYERRGLLSIFCNHAKFWNTDDFVNKLFRLTKKHPQKTNTICFKVDSG